MYGYDDYPEYFEMAEADAVVREYQEKMKELLIKPIIDNLNILQEENARLKKENAVVGEKTRELAQLKRDFERSKEEMVRAENEKYRRTLFDIQGGDIIYVVGCSDTEEKCPHCNGTHKIFVDILGESKKLDCPKCSYSGKIVSDRKFFPKKMIVTSATLHIYDQNQKSELTVYARQQDKNREDSSEFGHYLHGGYKTKFYPTIEECQVECDKRRKEWEDKK